MIPEVTASARSFTSALSSRGIGSPNSTAGGVVSRPDRPNPPSAVGFATISSARATICGRCFSCSLRFPFAASDVGRNRRRIAVPDSALPSSLESTICTTIPTRESVVFTSSRMCVQSGSAS